MMPATRGKGKSKTNVKSRAKGSAKSRLLGGGGELNDNVMNDGVALNASNSEIDGGRGGMSMRTFILGIFLLLTVFAIGFAVAYVFTGQQKQGSPVIQRVGVVAQLSEQYPNSNTIISSRVNAPTDNNRDNAPPVYPTKLPEYPLRHQPSTFQQVGALVLSDNDSNEPVILPLFGRKLSNRDRWEYYCASDKYHMTRLPVRFGNRDCEDDVGCDEIFNGQEVTVPDYGNKTFTARMYKYNVPRYN
ncbi:MAG: hypothetical protein EB127_22575 [Alphaproteobacteria bacterium]|nr:hypothetical protein [Alphaproteobacteria bacterium]